MRAVSRKRIKTIIIFVLIAAILAGAAVGIYFGVENGKRNDRINNIERLEVSLSAKNVIVMIGDGMGVNHIKVANDYYGQLYLEKNAKVDGLVNTFSRDNWVTDSAAAATAMSTGQKVNNRLIAMHKGQPLQTITEYAISKGKSTGIVVSEGLSGATPASFSTHAKDRNDSDDIIRSQIKQGITCMMGADKKSYDKYKEAIEGEGYLYTNVLTESTNLMNADKLFAAFSEVSLEVGTEDKPLLADMSAFALDYLSEKSGEHGFFLMIEGSHIDKRSHDNDMDGMLKNMKAFDETVKMVAEWADADGETAVFVTADHETGDLRYDGGGKDVINDDLFHSGGHTSADVRFFMFGISLPRQSFQGKVIDNTHVYFIAKQAIDNYLSGKSKKAA